MILKDPEIRIALRAHLLKRRPPPLRILEELGVHNGNAIADLVAFYNEMHCFEIKGATDTISRSKRQAIYYNEAFPKISLVTTENHINWCTEHSPIFWGLILAYPEKGIVKFKYIRSASHNPFFNKQKALMMLWKNELTDIATTVKNISVKRNNTREDIAFKISFLLKKNETLESIKSALLQRTKLNLSANKSNMTD